MNTIKWTARIIALFTLIFGILFYFGYDNPLPFINPEYSFWQNIVLLMPLLIFMGLAMGWKYEKIGGYLVIIPILIGFVVGITTEADFFMNLLFALIPGSLYLVVGYNKSILSLHE